MFLFRITFFFITNSHFTFTQPESSSIFQLSPDAFFHLILFSLKDKQCDYIEYLFSKLAAPKEGQWKDYYEASII